MTTAPPSPEVMCLVAFMQAQPDAGGCEPKILWMRDPARLDSVGDYLTWTGLLHHEGYVAPAGTLSEVKPIFAAEGACMLFRQSLLRRVELFEKTHFAGGDGSQGNQRAHGCDDGTGWRSRRQDGRATMHAQGEWEKRPWQRLH